MWPFSADYSNVSIFSASFTPKNGSVAYGAAMTHASHALRITLYKYSFIYFHPPSPLQGLYGGWRYSKDSLSRMPKRRCLDSVDYKKITDRLYTVYNEI